MLYNVKMSPQQVKALAKWVVEGDAMTSVLVVHDSVHGSLEVAQGDDHVSIDINGALYDGYMSPLFEVVASGV